MICLCLFVPLYIGATGMQAQQSAIETIAHNLANMSTTGYKRRRVAYQDLMYMKRRAIGSDSSNANTLVPSGLDTGLGVKAAGIYVINEQGSPNQTSHPYHLAIQGPGYFQVQRPDGTIGYTRDGTFDLSPSGIIVTRDGLIVQPGIAIPAQILGVTINTVGEVSVQIPGQTSLQQVGQFSLAIFPNNAALEAIGDNILLETPASGAPITGVAGAAGYGTLLQYYIESSNVNPITEITSLIMAQRAYEMNSKVIQATDQMMATMTQIR